MRFLELRKELVNNIDSITESDVLLLEGKLIFEKKNKADLVKQYLQDKLGATHEIIDSRPREWQHWSTKYESELHLRKKGK
jgi:hypothetical protein